MGPLLVGAAGLMGSTWPLRALIPAAASALRACRLGGLWSAAGSCGAFAPTAWGDFGVVRHLRRFALAALGDFGVVRQLRRVAPAACGDFGVDWGCLHNSRYYVAEF